MQKIALESSMLSCRASEASAVNSGETYSPVSLVSHLFSTFTFTVIQGGQKFLQNDVL